MKYPLLVLSVLLSTGIVLAYNLEPVFFVYYFCSGVSLLICLLVLNKEKIFKIFLCFLIIFLGAAHFSNSLRKPFTRLGPDTIIEGVVLEPFLSKEESKNILIYTSNLALIWAQIKPKMKISSGEKIVLQGVFKNYPKKGKTQLYFQADTVRLLGKGKIPLLWQIKRKFYLMRESYAQIFQNNLSGFSSAVAEAMVLGNKRALPPGLLEAMKTCGTVHILVVSGFNVGIVAAVAVFLLKIISFPRKLRIIPLGLTLIFYCLITGATVPVVRATIMALFFLVAYLFARQPDILQSLAFALLIVLIFDPQAFFDLGLQLSFASVLAIVLIYPRLEKLSRLPEIKSRILSNLISGGFVSLSAWLGTVVLTFYYFGTISFIAVIANILIVPLAAFLTLCAFALLLSNYICPNSGFIFSGTIELSSMILARLSYFFAKFPEAYFQFHHKNFIN